jgi:hypothetical protein
MMSTRAVACSMPAFPPGWVVAVVLVALVALLAPGLETSALCGARARPALSQLVM